MVIFTEAGLGERWGPWLNWNEHRELGAVNVDTPFQGLQCKEGQRKGVRVVRWQQAQELGVESSYRKNS